MESMTIEEMVTLVDSGAACSLKYVSFDLKRKTGGKVKCVPELVVTRQKSERSKQLDPAAPRSNHYQNFTRNFFTCISGQPTANVTTIHLYLVLEINGIKVMT